MSYESTQEDILKNVADFVEDNVGTYLTGITDAKDDGIDLPDFKEFVIEESDPFLRGKYPSCLMYPEEINDEQISSGWNKIEMRIVIMISITHGNASTILKQIMRYTEAIRQLLNAYPTCGNAVDEVDPKTNTRYVPVQPGLSDKRVAVMTITVKKEISSGR
jgi:hypothetical protein